MVGPTGTGKSVYMTRHLVQGLPKESWSPIFITFSARTSARMTQEQVDGRLDKRRKGMYGPPVGKKCVVFVDDINMPSKETYGAQPPIELLRQFMDYKGWYGIDNTFKQLVDVQFIAAMGPPGGGRTFLTNRYLRHFNTLGLAQVRFFLLLLKSSVNEDCSVFPEAQFLSTFGRYQMVPSEIFFKLFSSGISKQGSSLIR